MWQCDWKLSNTHVMTSFFFGLKIFINTKNIYEKKIFDFFEKKISRFGKIKILLWNFPMGFGLLSKFYMLDQNIQ
jgi:hypothetical protein